MTKDEADTALAEIAADAAKRSTELVERIGDAVHAEVLQFAEGLQPRGVPGLHYPPVVLTPRQLAAAVSVGVLAGLPGTADVVELASNISIRMRAVAQQLAAAKGSNKPC